MFKTVLSGNVFQIKNDNYILRSTMVEDINSKVVIVLTL
jgi:hypothetical protein